MELRLLGPVTAHVGDRPVDLGRRRNRFVLGVLALDVNRPVPLDRLVELCWPAHRPRTAAHAVFVSVSGLRTALSAAGAGRDVVELVRQGAGYVLRTDPGRIDVHRFRALLDAARTAADSEKIALLDEALSLWGGPVLDGAAPPEVRDRLFRGLDEARVQAAEDRLDAMLRTGRHREVLPELSALVDAHPLRERPASQLMIALYRSGRGGEALTAYRDLRDRLATELGLDPSPELRELERAILRDDPSVAAPQPPPPPPVHPPTVTPVPAQLPATVAGFAGRAAELRQLDAIVDGAQEAGPVVITAIAGTAGVGKTALAVHWAHRAVARFPDGQLYVNLRGFGPTESVTSPADVLHGFLDALGVAPQRIPVSVDARSALYRSLVAGRRILVVLDNARNADQVRPLLPGTSTALAVVTSRSGLSSLVAVETARPLTLGLPSTAEARELLRHRLGHRVDTEPDAVDEIIRRCARLPLALAVVAARAAANPGFSLGAVAEELRENPDRWDALTGDDLVTDVRAVFSWSYRALGAGAAALFRLLGLHPGPDLSAAAAASLAGVPPRRARALLDELGRAHLLMRPAPGRYSWHDLLHAYAGELAAAQDGAERCRAATHRLLDHYVHSAVEADLALDPVREPLTLPAPQPGVTPERFDDQTRAAAWFGTEYEILRSMPDHAAGHGFDRHAWELTRALTIYIHRRGLWHDGIALQQAAVAAADRLGDPAVQGLAHRYLATTYTRMAEYRDAETHYRRSLTLFAAAGDQIGQGFSHHALGSLHWRQGRNADALDQARKALELFRAAGHRAGQAHVLNQIGWLQAELGDYADGLIHCEQALLMHEELGDHIGAANAWDSIGYAHHHLGHTDEALAGYRRAVDLFHRLGAPYDEAVTLARRGDTYETTGRHDAARQDWTAALAILDRLGHPDRHRLRAKLDTPVHAD